MRERAPHQLVWCLGMYASASTWVFNATREVAQILYPDTRLQTRFAENMRHLPRLPCWPGQARIFKTHELTQDAAQWLDRRAGRIIISLRDPRDAVTSLVQHMGEEFAPALAKVEASSALAARLARDERTMLFLYETRFTEDEATFDRLAQALGGTLSAAQRAALFAATRRSKIEEKISAVTQAPTAFQPGGGADVLDPATQWHRHHAGRSGESGRWRSILTPPQVAQIEDRLADFMAEFGYKAEAGAS